MWLSDQFISCRSRTTACLPLTLKLLLLHISCHTEYRIHNLNWEKRPALSSIFRSYLLLGKPINHNNISIEFIASPLLRQSFLPVWPDWRDLLINFGDIKTLVNQYICQIFQILASVLNDPSRAPSIKRESVQLDQHGSPGFQSRISNLVRDEFEPNSFCRPLLWWTLEPSATGSWKFSSCPVRKSHRVGIFGGL